MMPGNRKATGIRLVKAFISVVDRGCLSRIQDPVLIFFIRIRISDLGVKKSTGYGSTTVAFIVSNCYTLYEIFS
jgi:hypothetical protein